MVKHVGMIRYDYLYVYIIIVYGSLYKWDELEVAKCEPAKEKKSYHYITTQGH